MRKAQTTRHGWPISRVKLTLQYTGLFMGALLARDHKVDLELDEFIANQMKAKQRRQLPRSQLQQKLLNKRCLLADEQQQKFLKDRYLLAGENKTKET